MVSVRFLIYLHCQHFAISAADNKINFNCRKENIFGHNNITRFSALMWGGYLWVRLNKHVQYASSVYGQQDFIECQHQEIENRQIFVDVG